MKIAELREKLSKLKKEELIKVASEFYKLISKAKKEDYGIDAFVDNPKSAKKSTKKATQSLIEIEKEVEQFIDHAGSQYYIFPNRVVPKKQRSTWRFKVKKWYKELINTKRADADITKQAAILSKLYELLCESCDFQYFTAFDTFDSIGIEQNVFFKSVIILMQEAEGKAITIEKAIRLIFENSLNRNTIYSELMIELMDTYDIVDLKNTALEITKKLLLEINYTPSKAQNNYYYADREEFDKQEKNNDLAEFGLRLHLSLFEDKKAVEFFKQHYYNRDAEIKLYVLVRILFSCVKKELIVVEIEEAIHNKIKPREKLLKMMKHIKEKNALPEYMY